MKSFSLFFFLLQVFISCSIYANNLDQLKTNFFTSNKTELKLEKGILYTYTKELININSNEIIKNPTVNIFASAPADLMSTEKFFDMVYSYYRPMLLNFYSIYTPFLLNTFNNNVLDAFANIQEQSFQPFNEPTATFKAIFTNEGFRMEFSSAVYYHTDVFESSWDDFLNKEANEIKRSKIAKEKLQKSVQEFKALNRWTEYSNNENRFKIQIPGDWFLDKAFEYNEYYLVKQTYPEAIYDSINFNADFDKINVIGAAVYIQDIKLMDNTTYDEYLMGNHISDIREELIIDGIKVLANEYKELGSFKADYFYYIFQGNNNNAIVMIYNGYGDFYDLHKKLSRKIINSLKRIN